MNLRLLRWLAGLLLTLVLVTAGWVAAGPWYVTAQIRDGIVHGDEVLLARHVDFPALRADLKQQLHAMLAGRAAARQDERMAQVVAGIAALLVDGMVERYVTPDGLAALSSGGEGRRPFANARHDWEAHDRHVLYVPAGNDDEVGFVLARRGLHWQLVAIRLPVPA